MAILCVQQWPESRTLGQKKISFRVSTLAPELPLPRPWPLDSSDVAKNEILM